jgi:hypothetical protein
MIRFEEKGIAITFPSGTNVFKFDDETQHGLSHCMKAVDFIVELDTSVLYIEIKNPQHPDAQTKDRKRFTQKFTSGGLDEDLKYKYRDSFLYQWASGKTGKPVRYYVLIALDSLTESELLFRTEDLKRKLPVREPSQHWPRPFVAGCAVFNIATWNNHFPNYLVTRIS